MKSTFIPARKNGILQYNNASIGFIVDHNLYYYKLYDILEIAKMSVGICSQISSLFPKQMRKMQINSHSRSCWYITISGLIRLENCDLINVSNLKPIIKHLQNPNIKNQPEPIKNNIVIPKQMKEIIPEHPILKINPPIIEPIKEIPPKIIEEIKDAPPEIIKPVEEPIVIKDIIPVAIEKPIVEEPIIEIPSIISKLDDEIEMYKQVIKILEEAKLKIRNLKKSML